MPQIECSGLSFTKADSGQQLVIRGDIKNNSGRDYNAVAVRVILFNKNLPLVSTLIVVNGVPNGRSKMFEKYVDEIDFTQIHNLINRHEVYIEAAY